MLGLLLAGWLTLPVLALLGAIGATGTVAYSVAAPALLPSLVARDQLARANRGLELARSSAYAAGPALGGALVGWTGAAAAYALAAMLSLGAVRGLAGLPEPTTAAPPRRHPLRELSEGTRFVATHALLRPILLTAVFFNTAWFILQGVYVAYAVQSLGLTATGVGMTLGAYGTGMVAGAVVAPACSTPCPSGGWWRWGLPARCWRRC
ncbi:MFS transporter [Pseudoroseomonas wenyumeiae]